LKYHGKKGKATAVWKEYMERMIERRLKKLVEEKKI
jgi:hypothetical protein